jgi:hypothetical protein
MHSAVHQGMTNPTTARIERASTHNDLEITDLVHRALAAVQDAGRFGDRKVFIASLWIQMRGIEAQTGGTLTDGATIEHFKVCRFELDAAELEVLPALLSRQRRCRRPRRARDHRRHQQARQRERRRRSAAPRSSAGGASKGVDTERELGALMTATAAGPPPGAMTGERELA